MNSLVLGSAGQIGTHLVQHLEQFGSVRTFDIVDSKYEDLRMHYNLSLIKAVADCDFVYFLAFDVGGSRYLKQYQDTFDFVNNNTGILRETFSVLQRCNKPFIFTSSQMSNMGYSAYGTLKRLGEHYTKALGGLVVKFWNVYGIEHDEEKSHVITDFIKKAILHGKIDMLTDGTEKRQFLYADDCCECLSTLADKFNTLDKDAEYHVTSFNWDSILQVAECISRFIPCTVEPSAETDTVQLDKLNKADTHVLQYWQPRTSLEEGIKKMCEHYQKELS